MQKNELNEALLSSSYETIRRAYYWNSFRADERAKHDVKAWSDVLAEDIAKVTEYGGDAKAYAEKFKLLLMSYYAAKSRVASAAVTGPAKFNYARNEKAERSERAKYETFTSWRNKTLNGLKKAAARAATGETDPNAVAAAKVEALRTRHARMIAANKAIKANKTNEGRIKALTEIGFGPATIAEITNPDNWWGLGFPSFELSSIREKIKRAEAAAKVIEAAVENQEEAERQDGVRIIQDANNGRLKIIFPGKPDADMIAKLKRNGFRWSPTNGCWQRQLTRAAIYAAEQILK